jgi:hypothetical protein
LERLRGESLALLGQRRLEIQQATAETRRLSDLLVALAEARGDLQNRAPVALAETEAELAKIESQIVQVQAEIDAKRAEGLYRRANYAVIPYGGPNGTRRRPIYIECRSDGVILQPEGIKLRESDFHGPLDSGNPLSAGVRTASEYLSAGDTVPAYPLLLVRPDGIGAYYAARAALKSWQAEFGYELIDQDWEVAYKEADPDLRRAAQLSVQEARVRQQQLVLSAPRLYGRGGGAARFDGGVGSSGGGRYAGYFNRGGAGSGGDSEEMLGGASGNELAGSGADSGQGDGFSEANGTGSDSLLGGGGMTGAGGNRLSQNGSAQGGAARSGQNHSSGMQGSSGTAGQTAAGAASQPAGEMALRRPDGSAMATDQAASGQPQRFGEYVERAPKSESRARAGEQTQSLAAARGEDWGLPDASKNSIPITRPLRVICDADQLTILSESGNRAVKSIPLAPRTEDSIDDFVSSIWEQLDGWGIAGKGMYWRPTLQMEVTPGGDARYQDLEALLAGSGLIVKRKGKERLARAAAP